MRALIIPLLIMTLLLLIAFTVRRESRFLSTVLVILAVVLMAVVTLGYLGYLGTN